MSELFFGTDSVPKSKKPLYIFWIIYPILEGDVDAISVGTDKLSVPKMSKKVKCLFYNY